MRYSDQRRERGHSQGPLPGWRRRGVDGELGGIADLFEEGAAAGQAFAVAKELQEALTVGACAICSRNGPVMRVLSTVSPSGMSCRYAATISPSSVSYSSRRHRSSRDRR